MKIPDDPPIPEATPSLAATADPAAVEVGRADDADVALFDRRLRSRDDVMPGLVRAAAIGNVAEGV